MPPKRQYRTGEKADYKHPYERAINLREYFTNLSIRQTAALIDGKIILNGREWELKEYEETFPAKLKFDSIQLDSRQAKNN